MLTDLHRQHLAVAMGNRGFATDIVNAINTATTDPAGVQRKKIEFLANIGDLNAKFVTLISQMPAGYILRYVGLRIMETVVAGGTGVKLAVGHNDGDVDAYGITDGLTTDDGFQKLFNDAPLASPIDIDLCIVDTDGAALGDSDITAGLVYVSIVWDEPARQV